MTDRYHRRVKRTPLEKDSSNNLHDYYKIPAKQSPYSTSGGTTPTKRFDNVPQNNGSKNNNNYNNNHNNNYNNNNNSTSIDRLNLTEDTKLLTREDSTPTNEEITVTTPKCETNRTENSLFLPDIPTKMKSKDETKNSILLGNHNPLIQLNHMSQDSLKAQISNVGLKNLGNTCFMNSALQCLFHLEPLVSYFLKGGYRGDINPLSPFKGTLAQSFADLLAEMYSDSSGAVIVPINFKKIVTKLAPHLLDYEQQDCQEFLRFLLDGLSEDLKRIQASKELNSDNQTRSERTITQQPTSQSQAQPQSTSISMSPSSPSSSSSVMPINQHRLSGRTIERLRQLSISSKQGSANTDTDTVLVTEMKTETERVTETMKDTSLSKNETTQTSNTLPPTPTAALCLSTATNTSTTTTNVTITDQQSGEVQGDAPKLIMVKDMSTIRTLQQKSRLRKGESSHSLEPHAATSTSATTSTSIESSLLNNSSESEKAWTNYLSKNDSIITEIFGGQLQSSIECLTCHHKSFCFDPFLDLSVPIGLGSSKSTVESCLESFSASELLEGDNAYFCEKCKQKQRSVKRLKISKCPRILVIHIKRFRYTSIRREKMFTDVNFPILNLDMSPYVTTELTSDGIMNQSYLYDLVAVAHHSGTLQGGHYIAHVDITDPATPLSDSKPQNWMCFNDARVTPTSSSSIGGPSAYILFYKLKSSPSSPQS